MSAIVKLLILVTLHLVNLDFVKGNQPPYFLPGIGDFATFSIPENFEVGTSVYKLKGIDPEGKKISYSISGPYFAVERDSGIVKLIKSLDRETVSELETIITITDEPLNRNEEPNTVSLRRIIPIRDFNDNRPTFIGRPYNAKIIETMKIGQILEDISPIMVVDKDEGMNSEVTLTCYRESNEEADSPCDHFEIVTNREDEGKYKAQLRLIKPVDYEARKSFILTILAQDGSRDNPLKSNATVNINVIDAQDQHPIFYDEPYSVSLDENLQENQVILAINATDGDFGDPNDVILSLEKEKFGFFKLLKSGKGQAQLVTTNSKIDRENVEILENGGYYTFYVKATEVLKNHTLGDSSLSPITIMIRDVDDNSVRFNKDTFNLTIPENLEPGTALPKLSIIANDEDIGINSRYNLTISNVRNADGVFEIFPLSGEGRTQIIVKVKDSARLDYDVDNEDDRTFVFEIIATVNHLPVSSTLVEVHLEGVNDNFPIFEQSNYRLRVEENSEIGRKIDDVFASDQDKGKFGKLSYFLRGFGSENFATDLENGGIYVKRNLDYEHQKSYSLTLIARDEGGRESNTNVFIDIIDLNDNYPQFELTEYYRSAREGSKNFEPQFFVKASDADGMSQGSGKIHYSIESENSISGHVFSIDSESGELYISSDGVQSSDTFDGTYDLIVQAEDFGHPPLTNSTRVIIRVGSENQRPIFRGNFATNTNIPGPPTLRVEIREDAKSGSNITMIQATDPDGDDRLLKFRLMDATDTFVINEKNGVIKLSSYARLDRDVVSNFIIAVNVVDSGLPSETSTATVKVDILDVNNKSPRFEKLSYTAYVPERDKDVEIIRVQAIDSDENAKLAYSIIEPIYATTKAGFKLNPTNFDYESVFSINESSGAITLLKNLENNGLYSVTLTVKAKDLNAEIGLNDEGEQSDTCEVIFYIQSYKESGPIFLNEGWNHIDKTIHLAIREELENGKSLIALEAQDPDTGETIHTFEMEPTDGFGYFQLARNEILTKKRIDYEEIDRTEFPLKVKAISSDSFSVAQLTIKILNINDNSPEFERKSYKGVALESLKSEEIILRVKANDKDAMRNERDEEFGYSRIKYSLTGPSASLFDINEQGDIFLRNNQSLDREKQSLVKFQVIAEDSTGKPLDAHKTTADVTVEVLDVNDVVPKFLNTDEDGLISAVIPESSQPNTLIVNLESYDPDEGPSGEVHYEIIDEGDLKGLLTVNQKTGELRNSKLLTGRGRSEPYEIKVRAFDQGNQIPKQRSLFTDQIVHIFIGDTFNNDGIPYFLSADEEASVLENSPIGTKVHPQLTAKDPDESTSPSGILRYRIQQDIEDAKYFKIEALSGIITTTQVLDREVKDKYNIIIEVSDQGTPPQSTARVLKINVLDVDDEMPLFNRDVQSKAVEMMVLEEQSSGSILGNVTAIDGDIGENGAIDYEIIDGNELGFFKLIIANNNSALLTTTKPIDRERFERFSLTVKCFPKHRRNVGVRKYDAEDLSMIQIAVTVVDIDDHLVEFEKSIYMVGIRNSIPLNTHIFSVRAYDVDPSSLAISYQILNVSFVSHFFRRDKKFKEDFSDIFELNNSTGEILLAKSVSDFVDGFFILRIRAVNNRFNDAIVKIFIIRDKSILKFVFSRPPMEMTPILTNFSQKIHSKLLNDTDLELLTFDSQVLSKPDQIYNFSSTSSCFMLFRNENALPFHEAMKLMNSEEMKNRLRETYVEYSVDAVDSCTFGGKDQKAQNLTMSSSGNWLVFLAFIVLVGSTISTLAACCIFRKSNIPLRYPILQQRIAPSADIYNTNDGQPVLYQEPLYTVM